MWLLFVRNGACGGGGDGRREGSLQAEVQSPPADLCTYECVDASWLEEEKTCALCVWTGFCVCVLVCRVREGETGQRVKVRTL